MSNETGGLPPAQGRSVLVGLAALFFVPLFAAFYLYYAGGWRPAGSTNHGELVNPARPLPAASFTHPDGAAARAAEDRADRGAVPGPSAGRERSQPRALHHWFTANRRHSSGMPLSRWLPRNSHSPV